MKKIFLCCVFVLISVNLSFAEFNFDVEAFETDIECSIKNTRKQFLKMTRYEFTEIQIETLMELQQLVIDLEKLQNELETNNSEKYNTFVPNVYPYYEHDYEELFNNIILDQGRLNES